MNAKEKAEELIIKMYQPLPASKEAKKGEEHLYYNQYNAAKQCAIIAVDELLNHCYEVMKPFWIEVKEEINKL